MTVFVLDKDKVPLMPTSEKRALQMLERGLARVHRMVPFTVRHVTRLAEDSKLQPIIMKIDLGSRTTGIAIVRKSDEGQHVLHLSQ